jgi:branched-chain amino acid transport system permease protein
LRWWWRARWNARGWATASPQSATTRRRPRRQAVPTLRLKLVATGLSGALMGMAGAPLPYYVSFLEPASTFNLAYAVNTIAMAMIGGTTTWLGPLIGAVLLATVQQVATVTISSEINLMVVGVLLVGFVMLAPNGIVGLLRRRPRS